MRISPFFPDPHMPIMPPLSDMADTTQRGGDIFGKTHSRACLCWGVCEQVLEKGVVCGAHIKSIKILRIKALIW